MSSRGTPASSYSRRYDTPPPSTPHSQSSSSLPPLRPLPHRASQTSTPSSSLLPLPHRQSLGMGSRKPSQASMSVSVSGMSTPRRSRAARSGGTGAGTAAQRKEVAEGDWANMDPDDVFKRLPVGEVRRVEARMRGEAMNKQSELRSMVGARYREVLTSATHVTTLYQSSNKLASSLRTVVQACTNPDDTTFGPDGTDGPSEQLQQQEEDVMSLLPVAAHLKLLLDAPEALYSYLAHHAYLNAAFLWLVTRVVKENLTSMPEETNAAYIPLLQKQWDILLPLRTQIVHRATASLRSHRPSASPSATQEDTRTLAETLLAVILLDNLPLSEALALLLSQRVKTVRDILSHHETTTTSLDQNAALSLKKSRRRASSAASTKSATRRDAREREHIGKVLTEAVRSLLETVTSAHAIFAPRPSKGPNVRGSKDESMMEELVRLVQLGQPAPVNNQSASANTSRPSSSHQRRASRLASISLPVSQIAAVGGTAVSAGTVIASLPASQILLRHLPLAITAFTPFIAPSPKPALDDTLRDWRGSAVQLLGQAVPGWLEDLSSVSDVWQLRGGLERVLGRAEGSEDFEEQIKGTLEEAWGKRVKEVWKRSLESLVLNAENWVMEAGEQARAGSKEEDTNPEAHLFSELAFPSLPSSTLLSTSPHTSTLTAFTSALRKRSAFRTPLVDSVLTSLESAAADLKKDLQGLPAGLYEDYGGRVKEAVAGIVRVLERVLSSMGAARGDGKDGVDGELFIGRIALFLARASPFLTDLAGPADIDTSSTAAALLRIHATSVTQWRTRSISLALTALSPIFDPSLTPREVRASWQGDLPFQPSAEVTQALHGLVGAVRLLGIPPGAGDDLTVVQELVEGFVDAARDLEGWKGMHDEGAVQAAVDLGFLASMRGDAAQGDGVVKMILAKAPPTLASDFQDVQLPSILAESLRRTQLLFAPLLAHLSTSDLHLSSSAPPTPLQSSGFADARSTLLRFGAPGGGRIGGAGGAGAGQEFRSPVAVARPGKRFGMLSIAA